MFGEEPRPKFISVMDDEPTAAALTSVDELQTKYFRNPI